MTLQIERWLREAHSIVFIFKTTKAAFTQSYALSKRSLMLSFKLKVKLAKPPTNHRQK